jgi:hypothetical protein
MANAAGIIRYFRECYEADNRETGIANLLGKKYRHVYFLPGEDDLLRGLLDRIPIDREVALAARREADLYRKDRTLILGAVFLVGAAPRGARLPARLCAPLVFYPAQVIDEDGVALLSVDLSQQRVNFPVLAGLAGEIEATRSLAEQFAARIPQAPFRREDIHLLIAHLGDFLPHADVLGLAAYPRLAGEKEVRRVLKSAVRDEAKRLECLPACALALVPNSPNTRGVLFELGEMADGRPLSPPLDRLLRRAEGASAAPRSARTARARVPAFLSRAQQGVLDAARSETLTLVVGPPGTGKSYTIAAVALDQLSRGRSVLVASRMNQAVDVVARKIEELIGPTPCVIRGGRRQHLRDLKKHLRQILHGMRAAAPAGRGDVARLERQLDRFDRSLGAKERRLRAHAAWETQWGTLTASLAPAGVVERLLRAWRLRLLDWRTAASEPLWELTRRYQEALGRRGRMVAELLQTAIAARIQWMLEHHRAELNKFDQALRARTDLKQQRLFSEISRDVLFGTFPIWLVTTADVSEVLPLDAGLFDLAIIDEATQCDAAGCLPILHRARRAVVVGDPNQLRHVSFLSADRQWVIAERNGLDREREDLYRYREKSVLDLVGDAVSSQRHVLFLNEHFRSMPQIIAFSNREFYSDALRVMTKRPETAALRCVGLELVPGGRKEGGTNPGEAEALVRAVVAAVAEEEPLPAATCHSLGVLSPFREQVDLLSSLIQERLSGEAVRKHDLMVGTAHSFQGEERDKMFLSLVVDPQSHPASFQFLNNPNVFNVAITRARSGQQVFCSVRPEDVASDTLLGRYLASVAAGPREARPPSAAGHDEFLEAVCTELDRLGFRAWRDYPAAGMTVDLVVEQSGRTLGIDLIGHPGPYAPAIDLERYRMFRRAGLLLFPLPCRDWRRDKDACLEAIRRWHERGLG